MKKKFSGSCHCKAVSFEFYCEHIINLIKCNCSICSHTNYLHLIIPHDNFNLLKGKNKIISYKFNTNLANHYFCKLCGIKSFYQPRSHKTSYSINYNSVLCPPKVNKIINFNGKKYEKNLEKIKNEF